MLFLLHEIFPRRLGVSVVRAGCRRYFRAAAPDYAVSAALRRIVGPLFAPALRLAVGAPLSGGYVRNFRENRAIPLRAKIVSLTLMWGTMLYCVFAPLSGWWWAQAALLAVAVGVTWHILSFATLKK